MRQRSADDVTDVEMNFGWVIAGWLAGCRGPRHARHLEFLRRKGIAALVRMAYERETQLTADQVAVAGLDDCYEPVADCTAPSQAQIDRVVRFVRSCRVQGKTVVISCNAGHGRTGTILACCLVAEGSTAQDALASLCRIRPGSKEVLAIPAQKEAVLEFERRLKQGEVSL